MTRLASIAAVLAAAGSYYLLEVDRRSPRALDLVELQGQVGVPLWALLAGAGVVLWWLDGRSARPPATGAARGPTRSAAQPDPPPTADGDWYAAAVATAHGTAWEQGVRVSFAPLPDVDVMLVVQSGTAARIKRSVRAFAALLSTLPRPHRVRIQLRQCDTAGLDLCKEVDGIFHTFWPRGKLRVLQSGQEVDVLFQHPEPGWPGQRV